MPDHHYCESIKRTKTFFDNATKCFNERDADFAPKPGMFTTAQQIAHAAQVIEWFVDGAFSPDGMNTDFEKMERDVRAIVTLKAARQWLDHAEEHAVGIIEKKTMMDLMQPISGQIMAGMPRVAIFEAIADHTAHHRGALAVYARLLDKVPPMPYE